jgi:hypothetical protein
MAEHQRQDISDNSRNARKVLHIETNKINKEMSHTIPQLQSIFSRIIAIGRKDGRISIYGAGNGELSTEEIRDNSQQAACAEPRLF